MLPKINKTFPEYLVNYEYLISIIENYGFVLLERDEARSLGLPESIGNFDQLFYEILIKKLLLFAHLIL